MAVFQHNGCFSAQSQSTRTYVFHLARICTDPIDTFQQANKYRTVSNRFLKIISSTREAFTSYPWQAGPTDAIITDARSNFFSSALCAIFRHAALSLRHQHTPLSIGRKSGWGQHVSDHKNRITIPNSYRDHSFSVSDIAHQLIPEQRLTHSHLLHVIPTTPAALVPKDPLHDYHKKLRAWGT